MAVLEGEQLEEQCGEEGESYKDSHTVHKQQVFKIFLKIDPRNIL